MLSQYIIIIPRAWKRKREAVGCCYYVTYDEVLSTHLKEAHKR